MPLAFPSRLLLAVLCGVTVLATAARAQPASPLAEVANAVSAEQLQSTITRLVGFGTRHTLSDTKSDTRGIGAARRWVQSRFAAMAKECGGCLQVVTPSQTVTGARVPQPTE
ncbi:MAG TPA: aminopeptidase, partial [Rhizobacter sp.]|nr:aminopeptidase [Rhizobacter sp.]